MKISWNDSVNSEEVFGNSYDVFRDDLDLILILNNVWWRRSYCYMAISSEYV